MATRTVSTAVATTRAPRQVYAIKTTASVSARKATAETGATSAFQATTAIPIADLAAAAKTEAFHLCARRPDGAVARATLQDVLATSAVLDITSTPTALVSDLDRLT
jgi:hypothetical protein